MAAYYWVDTSARGGVPQTALRGGTDVDGYEIFVGRAYHEGDWLPAKVIPGKEIAYVAYNGEEIGVHQFQVLCEQSFDWIPCQGGDIPPDAVQGGNTSDGEPLYVGRVFHEGSETVGKVHPSHGVCYIPFNGAEHAYPNYEILVLRH
ncbi:natterin-4-like [Diorhabda carinulata]|uniref:natterin-4-like n=1 Tax=Diorhabda sublineata TaxID=1163346 RepID=UPI0024E15E26|nr:natterin-4-like [Diorhabda sublineata]XP_057651565.1 natterin-4-like [Diorhabda carinulata]